MPEDRIREMPGDGADIDTRTSKVPGSDVRNRTRHPVNISSKNGAMSVSIASIDADAKANARIPIAMPFEKAPTQAMTGILL
jgi:hypothetical protein